MTLEEFHVLCQKDPAIDEALDDRQIGLLRRGNLILEGRLSGWLANRHRIPAFKIWVTCDAKERIRRLVQRDGGDVEAQREATERREASEADRYRRYYGADLNDLSRYDLVLDSTKATPEDLLAQVKAALAKAQLAKA
jgi:cytidylate kinase